MNKTQNFIVLWPVQTVQKGQRSGSLEQQRWEEGLGRAPAQSGTRPPAPAQAAATSDPAGNSHREQRGTRAPPSPRWGRWTDPVPVPAAPVPAQPVPAPLSSSPRVPPPGHSRPSSPSCSPLSPFSSSFSSLFFHSSLRSRASLSRSNI